MQRKTALPEGVAVTLTLRQAVCGIRSFRPLAVSYQLCRKEADSY